MSFILVVEPDAKSAAAIHKALAAEGLEVRSVSDLDAALQVAAARAPKLVIVNGDVQQADRLLTSFARREGGPGAIVLISANGRSEKSSMADELLQKPFTDSALKLAVERCWEAKRSSGASGRPAGGLQLSSEEIFGDVLAELEADVAVTPPSTARPDAAAPAQHLPVPERASKKRPPESLRGSVAGDVDSMLADTLAGLDLGLSIPKKAAAPPAVRPAASPPAATDAPAPTPTKEVSAISTPAEIAADEFAVEALEPVSGEEMEDSDSRSRMVLIGAIVGTALIGLLLVLLLNFRGDEQVEAPPATSAVATEGVSLPTEDPTSAATTVDEPLATVAGIDAKEAVVPAPSTSPPSTAPQKTEQSAPQKAMPPPTAAPEAETMVGEPTVAEPSVTEIVQSAASATDAAESQLATTDAAEPQPPTTDAAESQLATTDAAESAIASVAAAEVVEDPVSEDRPLTEAAELEVAGENPSPAERLETVVSRETENLTPTSARVMDGADEASAAAEPVMPTAASETPSVQVQPGELVSAGPGVVEPKLLTFAKPRYPEMARRLHKQGTVVVSVLVDETGAVIEAKLVQVVMATFDTAVLRAAKRATFTPATKNGVPVKMWRNIEVSLQADS